MLPSECPDVKGVDSISLRRMCREHLDMQFVDLRVLMRMPKAGFPAGCNFAATALIFNLVSGFSVCLYRASAASIAERGTSGKRFKGLLRSYFPWQDVHVSASRGIDVFYAFVRNPLAHALGLSVSNEPTVAVLKAPVSDRRIQELESSTTKPSWVAPPLREVSGDFELDVAGLYWGLHRMTRALLADATQRKGAEELARELGF